MNGRAGILDKLFRIEEVDAITFGVGSNKGFLRIILKDGRKWQKQGTHKMPEWLVMQEINEWIRGY